MSLTINEERQRKSLEEIRRCGRLDVLAATLGDIGRPFAAMPALNEYNPRWGDAEYDADLADNLVRFEEISAHWVTKPPLPQFSGEFSVRHLAHVLGQPVDPWAQQEPTQFRRDFMSSLLCFDSTPNSGTGRMSFLRMQAGVGPFEIWYEDMADIGGDPYPPGYVKLDLSYSEYIDALVLTKGTFCWQYLYAEVSLSDSSWKPVADSLKAMLEVFPELFPEYDYSPLRQRLEARL